MPDEDPLAAIAAHVRGAQIGDDIHSKWPTADPMQLLKNDLEYVSVDRSISSIDTEGGSTAALHRLDTFIARGLDRYGDVRNQPGLDGTSRMSPWLHFGHISVHQVFKAVAAREEWTPERLGDRTDGKREGWWGMSESAEAFLDELVTWREIGFNMCSRESKHREFDSLPDWAITTLEEHAEDAREYSYSLDDFAEARTHDEIWNAAQRQLVRDGIIHNYLRMLWGKKILHWTESPRQALEFMIELNNRYAIDGRDPNSYSGIFWVLGRYDRAWGPERPIFGKIRYMTSDSTRRKFKLEPYLERFGP